MPPAKKRKIVDESKEQDNAPLGKTETQKSQDSQHTGQEIETEPSKDHQANENSMDGDQERKERFRALQARAVSQPDPTFSESRILISI